VLFSRKDGKWKIADFGLSSEATSKHARTTLFSNGTPSYRAPELLNEEPKYTNKVDIWGLGCILYELLFGVKLFNGDWDVIAYRNSKSPISIPVPVGNLCVKSHLSGVISELLELD